MLADHGRIAADGVAHQTRDPLHEQKSRDELGLRLTGHASNPHERTFRVLGLDLACAAPALAGLLLEEGIPCVLSATMAGYTPTLDPRDVLVPESGAQAAREALKWERPGGERPEEA